MQACCCHWAAKILESKVICSHEWQSFAGAKKADLQQTRAAIHGKAGRGQNLALPLGSQLGVIDLGIAETLASVCGGIELRLPMAYDVEGLALALGPEYGEELLLL